MAESGRHMEAVLKNLESTLELLAVLRTDFVNDWDCQTVERAFQWGKYCEDIYARFHLNPSIRGALENCLSEANQRLEATFVGYQDVTFSNLAQCQHLLLIGLLQNPATPNSVIKELFGDFRQSGSNTVSALNSLLRCRSACNVLCAASAPLQMSGYGHLDTQAHGAMLLQTLGSLLCRPVNGVRATMLLDYLLQDGGGWDGISDVIACALLSKDDATAGDAAKDFLLDWMQGQSGLLHCLCHTLPALDSATLSQLSVKFRPAYWGILKDWALSLEYDVTDGGWRQSGDGGVSFNSLVERVRCLLGGGGGWAEEVEGEMEALKQAEGGFEVQGLSIWTDLLSELRVGGGGPRQQGLAGTS